MKIKNFTFANKRTEEIKQKEKQTYLLNCNRDSLDDLHLFAFLLFFSFWLTSKCLNYCLKASDFFVCLLLLLLFIFYQVSPGRTPRRKGLLHYYGKKIKTFASVSFSTYPIFILYFTVDYFALPGNHSVSENRSLGNMEQFCL